MIEPRRRGRPIEPRARFTISANLPAGSTPADELRAALASSEVVAWLAAQAGRGLACQRVLEVEVVAGRKPRLVLVSAR